jgi:hypothetical protein
MKVLTKFLLCVGALALTYAPSTGWAAGACVDGGTLASYIALGSTGCTIGDKTFSSFTYSGAATGTAVAIPSSGINVDTIGPSGQSLFGPNIGLEFVAAWFAGALSSQDSNIHFNVQVTGGGPMQIEDIGVAQGGSNFTGTGVAQVVLNACAPATCVPSGAINTFTIDTAGQIMLTNETFFSPDGSLSVIKDISVLGQTAGSASISNVDDTFSQTAVPIPGALPLFATGLVGLWGLRRKRSKQSAVAA